MSMQMQGNFLSLVHGKRYSYKKNYIVLKQNRPEGYNYAPSGYRYNSFNTFRYIIVRL